MNKVILYEQKIIDNITEGYPVTAMRRDGYKYVISMYYKYGEEVFVVQFGQIKHEFKSFNALMNRLSTFEFASISFK